MLVHGIYAGASSFEWRKNFDTLSDHFRVYALDLLGYGLLRIANNKTAGQDDERLGHPGLL